ncbi:MAG TPA: hypothetical protein PLV24_13795, partial [Anaerolineaceae bacterium]|nr:hypothetical protein [Anaerolineaceae bacterium]
CHCERSRSDLRSSLVIFKTGIATPPAGACNDGGRDKPNPCRRPNPALRRHDIKVTFVTVSGCYTLLYYVCYKLI